MHPDSVEIVRSLPHVYSVLLYKPVYKIESGLTFGEGFIELNVNAFSASDISELSSDIVSWGGSITELTWSSSRLALLQVNLPVDSIENLISSSRVVYIDAYRLPLPLMADTQWVNQGYIRNTTPIWDRGLSGEGEVIAVQEAECFSCNPPILYEFEDRSCFFAQPNDKVTFFGTAPLPCSYSGTGASSGCYHRTGVLAAAVGDAPPYLSPNSDTTYDALAYGSKTILASLANSNIFTFLDSAIGQGSRLGNFSYGGCGTMPMGCADGVYGTSAAAYDDYMWEKMLLGEHMLMFFAAGNEGSNTPPYNKIVRLASAKSIVTVGATERYWSSDPTRSPENMYSVSGWGPAADGRIKPDVTASGFKVRVPWLNDPNGTTCETVPEPLGTLGTSYASPIAASAAALVREYYRGGYYPGGTFDPSAALVKATLINSGRNMFGSLTGGDIPGDKQGWGRITLDDALHFNGEPGELQVIDNLTGLATDQEISYTVQVPDDNSAWELKVTLVWTDWPGSPAAKFALVNDLDLTVIGPSSSGTYVGNVFVNGYSVVGGTFDRLNVVEQIYLSDVKNTLTPGSYLITVSGYNVASPNGTQPYALLINLRHKLPYEQYLPILFNDGTTSATGPSSATPSPTPTTSGYPEPQPTDTPSVPYP